MKAAAELPPSLIGQYFKVKFIIGCLGFIVWLSESFYRNAPSHGAYWNNFHHCKNQF